MTMWVCIIIIFEYQNYFIFPNYQYCFLAPTYRIPTVNISDFLDIFSNLETVLLDLAKVGSLYQINDSQIFTENHKLLTSQVEHRV